MQKRPTSTFDPSKKKARLPSNAPIPLLVSTFTRVSGLPADDSDEKILTCFFHFFSKHPSLDDCIYVLDYSLIATFFDNHFAMENNQLENEARMFHETLTSDPNGILEKLRVAWWCARRLSSTATIKNENGNEKEEESENVDAIVRIVHSPNITALKHVQADKIGKWVAIRGTIVRVSSTTPLVTSLVVQCSKCDTKRVVSVKDGKYVPGMEKGKCSVRGCGGKNGTVLLDSSETKTVDMQIIKVQEKLVEGERDAGRVPRTIECELREDLVDNVIPGDCVTVYGTVKFTQTAEGKGKNKTNAMHVLYVDTNAIVKSAVSKQQHDITQEFTENHSTQPNRRFHDAYQTSDDTSFGSGNKKDALEFDYRDYYAIEEIASEPNLFRLLVNSLCPAIFGHELVKAGLLLTLFGGRSRYSSGSNIRGDPHILVVGDPGLGKSQLLSAVAAIAPRGVYVCSNTTSSSGLTVTMTREAGTGEFALEAGNLPISNEALSVVGALVLADQGCCCIDEFDKMQEYEALLEAMEQQSISIAKAGVLCSLPARTSVIAAANPVGGHYNKAKTVSENLKMDAALLSRFDLIFILLDRPNEEMDRFLSEHVINLHAGKMNLNKKPVHLEDGIELAHTQDESLPLHTRLKNTSEELDPIPPFLLRKYIAYSRQFVHPRLSPEAAATFQDFYLALRTQHRSLDSIPITTRQLESLIRLGEARARCELRTVVTKQDAEDVIEMMKFALMDTYVDEVGVIHYERSSGMSRKNDVKKFVGRLYQVFDQTGNDLFTYQQLYNTASELSIRFDHFQAFLDLVNHQGYLLKSGSKVYKLCFNG